MDEEKLRAGLLLMSRGLKMCADAIPASDLTELTEAQRELAFVREWGHRGLTLAEGRDLCAKWGFQTQKISAFVRGEWAEMRDDRRYLTGKSHDWIASHDPEQGNDAA